MTNNKEQKKKKKVGLKGVLIAMIVAILSLLGFGWHGTDWGQGNIGDQEQAEQSDNEDQAESEEQENTNNENISSENEDEEEIYLSFYIYEDKVYTDQGLNSEVSLTEVEEMLEIYEGKEVFIYDSGAIKQTYEEVEKIIDIYVDSRGLIKVKSETE